MSKKWTTLERLEHDLWEESRIYFNSNDMYHLIRFMFYVGGSINFNAKAASCSIEGRSLFSQRETIVKAMQDIVKSVSEIELNVGH